MLHTQTEFVQDDLEDECWRKLSMQWHKLTSVRTFEWPMRKLFEIQCFFFLFKVLWTTRIFCISEIAYESKTKWQNNWNLVRLKISNFFFLFFWKQFRTLHYHRKWQCSTMQLTVTSKHSCWTRSQVWTNAVLHDRNSAKTNMESEYHFFMREETQWKQKIKRELKIDLFIFQTCSWQFNWGTRSKSKHSCVQRNARIVSNHPFRRLCTWRK